jgi:hypothetical protein
MGFKQQVLAILILQVTVVLGNQYHLISMWWFLQRSCTFHFKISASIMVFASKKDFMS